MAHKSIQNLFYLVGSVPPAGEACYGITKFAPDIVNMWNTFVQTTPQRIDKVGPLGKFVVQYGGDAIFL